MMQDGTLIYTNFVGPCLRRTVDLEWTHVLIGLRGFIYEAAPPRVKRSHNLPRRVLLQPPKVPYTEEQINLMVQYAMSQLGRKYQWTGFFCPRYYGRTRGVYCSQYACNILRAGKVPIAYCAGYSPDTLKAAMEAL